ncbi:hypothetical protein GCM10011369_00160 [Neiella marina]|uniref:Right-handed parallel beta-helix repeat-containing protein n=1 Tax=Neiella marina TaxID=508461 RepID=A0A8J2XMA9_9GAMM|nr:right-handed parallel beta-helix repeat-containing protein [Neiella marina]GGA62880.1 hypothetical protein GCM10011369_00160 [Neiella marina]
MKRRDFIKNAGLLAASSTLCVMPSLASEVADHPDIIRVTLTSNNHSLDLQRAFDEAYLLWQADPSQRRPIIELPDATLTIGEIENNSRGQYPFRLPPTFKLRGAGKGKSILVCEQPKGAQYRLLMTRFETRADMIEQCPSLSSQCVESNRSVLGASYDIHIEGISFVDFDNAIVLRESQRCKISNCSFEGSLLGIQLLIGDVFGNVNHTIENCDFDAARRDGSQNPFCIRFEAPFSVLWTNTEYDIDVDSCEQLGKPVFPYHESSQRCSWLDSASLERYVNSLFGENREQDVANKGCFISRCQFRNAGYSAIEFAGPSNTDNIVTSCGFYNCSGTAVEFDKGASRNTASYNFISGMKPTTAFGPSYPYIFQAAIQEQEGLHQSDVYLKDLIEDLGFARPDSPNFKGVDIFERASELPVGNQISNNVFEVSRSYYISEYEVDANKAAVLPDIYPSIKLNKSLNTVVANNMEISSSSSPISSSLMGSSIVWYPDDTLRSRSGGVTISGNKFHGGLYVVGDPVAPAMTETVVIEDNEFGFDGELSRGGFNWNYLKASEVHVRNNRFYCGRDSSSSVMQRQDVSLLRLEGNHIQLSAANSLYIRSSNALEERHAVTQLIDNVITGGVAISIYDYEAQNSNNFSNDSLLLQGNTFRGLSDASKVVGLTLWYRNIQVHSNHFDSFEDKVFQLYSLSDDFSFDYKNELTLTSSSSNRVYDRNYQNSAGRYVTSEFWLS